MATRWRSLEERKLHGCLTGADNLDWLCTFAFWHIRDQLLPTMSASDPRVVADFALRQLCEATVAAILAKLRRKYPAGARRADDALVRSYPEPVKKILDLEFSRLTTAWTSDLVTFPESTFASRVQRLLPILRTNRSARGKSRAGDTIGLVRLAAYEEALELIPPTPAAKRGYSAVELAPLRKGWPSLDVEAVRHLNRDQIARLFACRAIGDLAEISVSRFRHMLPRLRELSGEINCSLGSSN